MPADIQQLVIDGALGQRHACELLRLLQHEPPLLADCLKIAQRAVDHEMTVAQVERSVTNFIENRQQAQRIKARAQHQETRYCRFCGREHSVNGNQIDLNDSLTCEGCHKRRGISIYALAQEIRMPHHNVKRIVDSPMIPDGTNYKTLLKLAEALGVTIDDLEAKT